MAARRPFWKWLRWKSIGFCLWPPSTCILNLKLKFQRKLDLCSGKLIFMGYLVILSKIFNSFGPAHTIWQILFIFAKFLLGLVFVVSVFIPVEVKAMVQHSYHVHSKTFHDELTSGDIKYIFEFYIICQQSNGTGSWNTSSWKTTSPEIKNHIPTFHFTVVITNGFESVTEENESVSK